MADNIFDKMNLISIKNSCVKGQCSSCGECCTDFIPLSKKEHTVISKYIIEHNLKEHIYTSNGLDVRCPFYNKDNPLHCDIYEVRPQICKGFKCCLNKDSILKNKNNCNNKAFYNHFNWKTKSYDKSFISLHNLFFNNADYETAVLFYMAREDATLFKTLCKDCMTNYVFTEEENCDE